MHGNMSFKSAEKLSLYIEFSASKILSVIHDVIFSASAILRTKKHDTTFRIPIVFHRKQHCVQVLRELQRNITAMRSFFKYECQTLQDSENDACIDQYYL